MLAHLVDLSLVNFCHTIQIQVLKDIIEYWDSYEVHFICRDSPYVVHFMCRDK